MTKLISLSDEAYGKLKNMKESEESFSKVVLRLSEKEEKKPLMAFFGAWAGDKKELEDFKKSVVEDRKKFRLREVAFD